MLSKKEIVKESVETIDVSVVIPCYNARQTISETLNAISGQRFDGKFEIIVIDSSNDGTDEIIRKQFPQVHLIRLEMQTLPGSGRNLGVTQAKGEIVAFTDSDAVPAPDWLEKLVNLHHSQDTDAVGGCVINGYSKSLTAWVSQLIEFNEWTESTPAGYVSNIPSVNISFKREVFKKYRICYSDIFPSEDTLFNWSLIERGGRIYFDPAIRVTHLSRVGFFKLFRHQLRLGRASAQARRISTLPGRTFVQHPWLCIILPPVRWIRASMRLIKKDIKLLCLFWALTPLYIVASTAWTIGFMQKGTFNNPVHVIEGCDFDQFGKKVRN